MCAFVCEHTPPRVFVHSTDFLSFALHTVITIHHCGCLTSKPSPLTVWILSAAAHGARVRALTQQVKELKTTSGRGSSPIHHLKTPYSKMDD